MRILERVFFYIVILTNRFSNIYIFLLEESSRKMKTRLVWNSIRLNLKLPSFRFNSSLLLFFSCTWINGSKRKNEVLLSQSVSEEEKGIETRKKDSSEKPFTSQVQHITQFILCEISYCFTFPVKPINFASMRSTIFARRLLLYVCIFSSFLRISSAADNTRLFFYSFCNPFSSERYEHSSSCVTVIFMSDLLFIFFLFVIFFSYFTFGLLFNLCLFELK